VSDDRHPRTVKLPFDFGDIVYHRAAREKLPGMVVGFVITPLGVKILVRWGHDLSQDELNFFELSTEFTPSFED
jgi:hypothetical protein